MKKLFLFFAFAFLSNTASAQTTWKVDPMHSFASFNIKHMGISFVEGRFDKMDGTVTTTGNALNNAKFDFMIDVNSINTNVEMRDNHLKSADFFEAEKFPAMKFVSTSIKKGKGNSYILTGNLTIKDVTKKVSVPVTYGGIAKNQQGKEVLGFQTNFIINRLDYNIKYDPTGGAVAKYVDIKLFVELVK
ncbi:YceI family protein [Chryseobacterium sp.]|uniref:YceI family protein n=1 Tax=Chryseobacterium sp. TaxID=1871047 RepID=UPI0011C7DB3E|nr:YceI family protein [Chryseobacterium sp.]TXF77354.1 YceI family protein [Chryseobacterium sp.]